MTTTTAYYLRCAVNLARYGRKSDFTRRYGFVETVKRVARVEVRSHWLKG